jgi:hypothetical protein
LPTSTVWTPPAFSTRRSARPLANGRPELASSERGQKIGWYIGPFQRDEVARVRYLDEFGARESSPVGLSVRGARPVSLPIHEVNRGADLGVASACRHEARETAVHGTCNGRIAGTAADAEELVQIVVAERSSVGEAARQDCAHDRPGLEACEDRTDERKGDSRDDHTRQ